MKALKMIIKGLLFIVLLVVVYIVVISLIPGMNVTERKLKKVAQSESGLSAEAADVYKNVGFDVKGDRIDAWLFIPEGDGPFPCVVMAHGLGGVKAMGLAGYAARFRDAGIAVLVFDYRYFGGSGGKPRHLIWIPDQLEDWSAAVEYAENLPKIDVSRIALWGTSFSGGHVVVTAALNDKIAAVIAQCPALDGRASAETLFERNGIGYMGRMIAHGQRDYFRSLAGLSPHKIPVVGPEGSIALMNTEEAYELFSEIAPPDYVNEACARIVLRGDKYRPIKQASNLRCPVLFQVCEKDDLAPPASADEIKQMLGDLVEVKHYPIGHFDIYKGEHYETAITDQIEFLKRFLIQ